MAATNSRDVFHYFISPSLKAAQSIPSDSYDFRAGLTNYSSASSLIRWFKYLGTEDVKHLVKLFVSAILRNRGSKTLVKVGAPVVKIGGPVITSLSQDLGITFKLPP